MRGMTLFTGGGGADIGMQAAGIEIVGGIEYDPAIAEVARQNGFPVTVCDILNVDPYTLPYLDVLHASPPCPNFSNAKHNKRETEHDIALARKVADIVILTRPTIFTLENVPAYARSASFQHIVTRLARAGYMLRWQNINAADLSVPQTRRRLWLRAVREGLLPELPAPEPWRGWYQAIEDLIPGLPESQFAPWQLARLPEKYASFLLPATGHTKNEDGGMPHYADEPAQTIRASRQGIGRAFIVPGGNASSFSIRGADEPARTVGDVGRVGNTPRAWLSQGRVVAMTPRCLARFQSFPDWYALPENNALACRIIGNAVPSLLFEKLLRQMVPSA